MPLHCFQFTEPFTTESGQRLAGLRLAYHTFGTLNPERDNVIWIFHALTANSNPDEWWPGMLGAGCLFDPDRDFIICVNMPGSCYGSTGPLDINPDDGRIWYHDFPFFTILDMVRAYQMLRDHLGIQSIKLAIGGSTGGMQALEWAILEPDFIRNLALIATSARHTPWGIAFNASQRMAIEADHTWSRREPEAGIEGMKVARSIALISYRSYEAYSATQNDPGDPLEGFRAESYQKYQGEKLARRFNAFSYHVLSRSMDSHHVGRNRGGVIPALSFIRAHTLVIGIRTDQLFPVKDQEFLAEHIPGASLEIMESPFGHDGFLLESEQLSHLISKHKLL